MFIITGIIAIVAIIREVPVHFLIVLWPAFQGNPKNSPGKLASTQFNSSKSQRLFLLRPLYDYQACVIVVI
jgi:hypothetical protein